MVHRASIRPAWLCAVGVALLCLYALPLFVPPRAPSSTPPADAALITQLFPQVPWWWVTARLLALVLGAVLVALTADRPAVQMPTPLERATWRHPRAPQLASLAAAAHCVSLAWRSTLTPIGQTLFMLGLAAPAAILAWGASAPSRARAPHDDPHPRIVGWPIWSLVAVWLVFRVAVSWHSPRAADVVDMWRVFGGFVQLAGQGGNFLIAALDPELPGLTAILLFFQGFPLFQMMARVPDLTAMQIVNAGWLAVCALTIAALASALVGRSVAIIAAAAFLFAPFTLVAQLSPMPSIQLFIPALAGWLLIRFYRSGSAAALVFLAAVVGLSAGMPPLVPMTGLALVLVARRIWTRRDVSPVIAVTALLSLLTGAVASLPSPGAIGAMVARYAASQIPLAVAEQAVHGQLSPTIEDWLGGPLPEGIPLERLSEYRIPVTRGWLVVPVGVLVAPFAIPRWPLRLWGDTLFEPFSAALAAVGLAVCLRHARRDRTSLIAVLFLAAALLPAFASSYDRPSVLRLFGAPVPVALLAAAGLETLLRVRSDWTARRWAPVVASVVIAVSGSVIFDVVNPRILPASSLGLLARSVNASERERAGLLTSYGRDKRPDIPPGRRYWEFDWLRHHHPYVQEILRSVPEQPIPFVDLDRLGGWNTDDPEYRVLFWSPALEQTTGVTDRLCHQWPDAMLYTVVDAAGQSRLYAARLAGEDWAPAVPRGQWTARRCDVAD